MCQPNARFCGRASACRLTHTKATRLQFQGIRLYMFLRTSKARKLARLKECVFGVGSSQCCTEVFRVAALWRSLARPARISGPTAQPGQRPLQLRQSGLWQRVAAEPSSRGQPGPVSLTAKAWAPASRARVQRPVPYGGAGGGRPSRGQPRERNQQKAALARIALFGGFRGLWFRA